MKKGTLGKGLDALIPKEDKGSESKAQSQLVAPIYDIHPNTHQPRKEFDDSAISELAASIKEKGILQPLIVRQSVKGYEIIAGERRWRAAQSAGVTEVPIIVKEATDREMLELALIENLQREDLNPIEEAYAYQHLINDFGLTHEDVSQQIGKDRSTITNQLRLLRLPDEAKSALTQGDISTGHARALLSLELESDIIAVLGRVLKQKLSVRKTEQLIQNLSKPKPQKRALPPPDPYILQTADEMKKSLGTQVKIVNNAGRGKIEIEFYSESELERLTDYILGKF